MDWTLFGAMVTGFLAIINPVSSAPIFANVTAGSSPEVRNQVARRAVAIAFGIILVFTVAGNLIFSLFGITLTAFRMVGGVLVMIVGFEMVHGQSSRVHAPSDEDQEDSRESQLTVAVSPLGTPLVAGPGTISTAMGFAGDGNLVRVGMTLAAAALICAVTLASFYFSARLMSFLGKSGMNVVSRLMGLIIAVIGMQMLLMGVYAAIAGYAGYTHPR
ncbi:MAG: MarC family protein [Bryobacterales bacterium]|nr:MarC family protein [Bryobacterales bacterium]